MSQPPTPPALAGDADREAALALLREAAVDGRLTIEELATRAERAHAARTHADLRVVTADLVVAGTGSPAAPPSSAPPLQEHRTVLALARHAGRSLGARTRFSCVLGRVHVDLRDVLGEGPGIDVEVHAVLGAVKLVLPEGVQLELVGEARWSYREVSLRGAPVAGSPVVRMHVSGLWNSVTVRSRPRLTQRLSEGRRGRRAG